MDASRVHWFVGLGNLLLTGHLLGFKTRNLVTWPRALFGEKRQREKGHTLTWCTATNVPLHKTFNPYTVSSQQGRCRAVGQRMASHVRQEFKNILRMQGRKATNEKRTLDIRQRLVKRLTARSYGYVDPLSRWPSSGSSPTSSFRPFFTTHVASMEHDSACHTGHTVEASKCVEPVDEYKGNRRRQREV